MTTMYNGIKPEPVTASVFQDLGKEMSAIFQEREDELKGLLVATIARANILFLGSPGTGKTAMSETLCNQIDNANYFQRLLTRVSSPEEIVGSLSIKGLENDLYIRNTSGKLPEANVAVLDEIFKCNSPVLNINLPIMNERVYYNDSGQPSPIPLMLFVGLSNELPEGGVDGELSALWDRFHLRYVVSYIKDERHFANMLKLTSTKPQTRLTLGQIKQAQIDAQNVLLPDTFIQVMVRLWKELKKEGFIVSDRRFRESIRILKAHAWYENRQEVTEDDLDIVSHMFWSHPDQFKAVRKIILGFANPLNVRANEIYDAATEQIIKIRTAPEGMEKSVAATEANHKVRLFKKELEGLLNRAKNEGKGYALIEKRIEEVESINQEIVKILLGI